MSKTILSRTLRKAAFSSLLLAGSALAAQASPAVSQPPSSNPTVASADRPADRTAADDLQKAMSALAKGNRRATRDLLERADTAMLNREVLDLGPSLRVDRPLPQTPLRQQIERAEAALHRSGVTANGEIRRALAAVDADMTPPHTT
jgi:hypothetical protein